MNEILKLFPVIYKEMQVESFRLGNIFSSFNEGPLLLNNKHESQPNRSHIILVSSF